MKQRPPLTRAHLLGFLVLIILGTVMTGQAAGRLAAAPEAPTLALGTTFTYQGQLIKNGVPHTDTCNLRFRLFDDPSAGGQVGTTQTINSVSVSNGLFTVPIDFGQGAFNGNGRWLEIAAQCSGDPSFVTLSPRQPLTPAPYALALPGLYTQENATSPNLVGGFNGNAITNGVVGGTVSGGGDANFNNEVTDNYGSVGGGRGNTAGNSNGVVTDGIFATIGGGVNNTASANQATICGGLANNATGINATIAGGQANNAVSTWGTIGGGQDNFVSSDYATVAGGDSNTASGNHSFVGGGELNSAAALYSSICGGQLNHTNADFTTIPGGLRAVAEHYGEMAYASGRFSTDGDAQTSLFVARNTTTNNVVTELFLDGSGQRLNIPVGSTMTFDILIVGRTSANASAGYRIVGVIENAGGTTGFIGSLATTTLGEDITTWSATASADNANDALIIQVVGSTGTTIRWVAVVRAVIVKS